MKKLLFVMSLILLLSVVVFAESPEIFAFTLGSGAAYDVNTGDILGSNNVGFSFIFNDTFAGGFSFNDIAGVNVDVVNVTVEPMDKVTLSMYTGTVDSQFGFGLGFGYSLFQKKNALFTSLGLHMDWFAGNGGTFDVANGGVILLGLKTQIGL